MESTIPLIFFSKEEDSNNEINSLIRKNNKSKARAEEVWSK
jgi:hypothetical protein